MESQNFLAKIKHVLVPVAGVLSLLFLLVSSLYFFPLLSRLDSAIFGNDGDGFFNLWVMRHNYLTWLRGDWSGILDAGIFYPQSTGVMLKSDTLFLPSVLYSFFALCFSNSFVAYNATALLLSFAAYLAYWYFFQQVIKVAAQSLSPWVSLLLSALFAWMLWASMGRLIYYEHFQNLSSFWVVLLLGAAIAFLSSQRRRDLRVVLLSFVALNYSTQYFAILGGLLGLLFGLFLILSFGVRRKLEILRESKWDLVISLVLVAPILWVYLQAFAGKDGGIQTSIAELSWKHFVNPHDRSLIYSLLAKTLALEPVHHERPAYLGVVFVMLSLFFLVRGMVRNPVTLKNIFRYRLWWISLVMYLLCIQDRHSDFLAVCSLLSMLLMVCGLFVMMHGAIKTKLMSPALGFVILACLMVYSVSFGFVGVREPFFQMDVSVWGLLASWIPGANKIRAIGRFAPIGQCLVVGAFAWFVARSMSQRLSATKGLVLVSLLTTWHTLENYYPPLMSFHSSSFYHLNASERQNFSKISSPALVLPSRHFHNNASYMLQFVEVPELKLINGYSGSSTVLFDAIMDAEHKSLNLLAQLIKQHAETVILAKWRLSEERMNELKAKLMWSEGYRNERFLVLHKTKSEL